MLYPCDAFTALSKNALSLLYIIALLLYKKLVRNKD